MAVVGDFLVGKALDALYSGVEKLIGNHQLFKSLSTDIKSKLDSLRPMIQEMEQRNQQSDCPEDPVLRDLRVLMEEGAVLIGNCFSDIRIWYAYKKYKYTNKLLKLNDSLENQLKLLNVRVAIVVDKNRDTLQDILKAVVNQYEAGCALPELPPFIVGLDIPLKELKTRLFKDEVSRLVLTAPGGCGKTTLATKFCQDQDVKDKFKNNIFFVTVCKKPNLELIMKELYKQKGYKEPTFQNGVFPVKWLQQIEKEKGDDPLLLVLDDVWSGSESLLEKFEFKMSNYKILVTSRSEFPGFGSSYHLQLLDNDNAMRLFHHTASLEDKSSHIPKDLSKEIVKHCNGFPLAIIVTGRSLCAKPIQIWQSRVSERSKGFSILDFEMNLLLCLKSSLDALDDEMPMVKECFLDLGAFPEDAIIQVTALIDIWAELYDLDEETSCIAKLYELNNRNLARLREGGQESEVVEEERCYSLYFVRQHDLLRELAIYISKQDPIERRERLIIEISGNNFPKWWREQKYQSINARLVSISTDGEFSVKLPNMQLPEAEVLVLNFQSKTYALPEFVERMDKLKMFVLINYSSFYSDIENFQLLDSLSNLRSIRLESINVSFITKSPLQLKTLHKLYLSNVESLGNGPVKLSLVFPNLKEMVINDCHKLEELPAEICELIHLRKLTIIDCTELSVLPEAIGDLVNLEVLRLRLNLKVSEIPDSIGNLNKLKFLDITSYWKIEKLPEHMDELKCLTNLSIMWCKLLSALPEAIGNLANLEVLSLRYCYRLSELSESIRNLKKLTFLDIHWCGRIKELPEQIGELKSLRKLQMSHCPKLTKLPQSVSDLQQLEEVICDEWATTHLWTPLLPTLKNLRIVVYKGER